MNSETREHRMAAKPPLFPPPAQGYGYGGGVGNRWWGFPVGVGLLRVPGHSTLATAGKYALCDRRETPFLAKNF